MDPAILAQAPAVDGAVLQDGWATYFASPMRSIAFACVLLVAGIFLLLPPRGRGKQFWLGGLLTALAIVTLLLPTLVRLPAAPVFFLLEGLAVLGGLGTVVSRNPVYSAIWFAAAVLAVGATLLMAGAQFLGLASVAVYAGAIVVTFLFVLMLAQPEGHAIYDRLGWGWFPSLCASLAAASVVAIVASGLLTEEAMPRPGSIAALKNDISAALHELADRSESETAQPDHVYDLALTQDQRGQPLLKVRLAPESGLDGHTNAVLAAAIRNAAGERLNPATRITLQENHILAERHVARLGGELFGRHLIAIQVAGVLLTAALVGAIAMAIHGKEFSPQPMPERSARP